MQGADRSAARMKIGIGAMAASCVLWPMMFAAPFLPLSASRRVVAGSAIFIVAEVLFWGGALIAGREAATRYREKLNPSRWMKKKAAPLAEPASTEEHE